MKGWQREIITVMLRFVALLAVAAFAVFLFNHLYLRETSLDERVELLEKKMDLKMRPVINRQNASVYNSDGEIVIEEH